MRQPQAPALQTKPEAGGRRRRRQRQSTPTPQRPGWTLNRAPKKAERRWLRREEPPSSPPSERARQPAPQPPSPVHIVSETKTPRPVKPPKETSCQGMGRKATAALPTRERIMRACRCFGGAAAPSAAPGRPAGQSSLKLQKNIEGLRRWRGKGERSLSNTAALAVRAKKERGNRSLPPSHRQQNL